MSEYYKVEPADGPKPCEHCGQGGFWTIISGPLGDETAIGSAWADRELVEDICDLMNMAFDAGMEIRAAESLTDSPPSSPKP